MRFLVLPIKNRVPAGGEATPQVPESNQNAPAEHSEGPVSSFVHPPRFRSDASLGPLTAAT